MAAAVLVHGLTLQAVYLITDFCGALVICQDFMVQARAQMQSD